MASSGMVEVVEHCRVAVAPPSLPATSLPLTYLDLFWFLVPPVQRLFFYRFHHPKDHFFHTLLPNLKRSLSLTLRHFFPLLGNLTWPEHSSKPQILYTDGDTVPLTVAESTYDFHSLLGNHARSADEFYNLVPSFGTLTPTDRLVPLMCLQVTLFPDSGICIGISVNHVCADGRTSNHFLKSWASVCRAQGDDASLLSALPDYNRPVMDDQDERERIILSGNDRFCNINKESFNNSISPTPPPGLVRATFVMRPSDITKLRHWVISCITSQLRLSSFVLTCAYVWTCLIKSQHQQGGGNYREQFFFAVDCRDQVTPRLSSTYFGNFFGFGVAASTTEELVQENGVAIAAELIVKGIQQTRSDMWGSIERIYSGVQSEDGASTKLLPRRIMSVAGSPKLAVYETDFGWGKPDKVEVISIGERGSISLSESPGEEGALEIGLVGSIKDMNAFASLYANSLNSLSIP